DIDDGSSDDVIGLETGDLEPLAFDVLEPSLVVDRKKNQRSVLDERAQALLGFPERELALPALRDVARHDGDQRPSVPGESAEADFHGAGGAVGPASVDNHRRLSWRVVSIRVCLSEAIDRKLGQ